MSAYQAVGAAAAMIAILTALFRATAKLDRQWRAFEATKALAEKNDEMGKLLLRASIAILDGLRQQGCNGKVTEMHETLIRHAVEK